MNSFDHFIKHTLEIQYYGRYVDDFLIVHSNRDYLKSLIPVIRCFFKLRLNLTLHPDKIYLQHYSKGVQYLGVQILPHRTYIKNRTKGNFYKAVENQNNIANDHRPSSEDKMNFISSINSYLGIMKHYKTYGLKKKIIDQYLSDYWKRIVVVSGGYNKMVVKNNYLN